MTLVTLRSVAGQHKSDWIRSVATGMAMTVIRQPSDGDFVGGRPAPSR
jgi:hypothetical protein